MSAQTATLEEDQTTKVWRITLNGVNEDIVGYSDRPQRDAQTQKVSDYINLWPTFFRGKSGVEVPPNAVILGRDDQNNILDPVPFVLTNPTYDATARRVTFDATLVNAQLRPLSSNMNVNSVGLAIDSVDLWDMIKDCGSAVFKSPATLPALITTVASCGVALATVETVADVAVVPCLAGAAASTVLAVESMLGSKQCKCAVCKIANSHFDAWVGCYEAASCTGADK